MIPSFNWGLNQIHTLNQAWDGLESQSHVARILDDYPSKILSTLDVYRTGTGAFKAIKRSWKSATYFGVMVSIASTFSQLARLMIFSGSSGAG